jgi:HAD superfamily hydrolase (TIGR01509 family)
MYPIGGVILDIDGTLVDSNDAHARSWVEALAEQGIQVALEKVRKLIGMGSDKLLPRACGVELDSPRGKKISARREEIFKSKYLPALKPTRGARELLRQMQSRRLEMVVASSAKKDDLAKLLHICGADEVIKSKTSSEDVDRSKPDPDIVESVLPELGVPAREVVMLGDTPYDIESAGRAGVGVIAFRCGGGWGDEDLKGALAVYQDPADLLAHYDSSPLGQAVV